MTELKNIQPLVLEPVTRLELIKYAGASGDYNPIHTIDEEAEKTGLPGIICHGMLSMAKMARLFTPFLEKGCIETFSTRFTGMVFINDVITIQAELLETEGQTYTYSVVARNQKDDAVAKGKLTFRLYE